MVAELLESKDCFIKKFFDCSVGLDVYSKTDNASSDMVLKTIEGWKIEQISIISTESYPDNFIAAFCKAGLVNIVLENYKRVQLGIPIIPILFIADISNNAFENSVETISSREEFFNNLITNKELRRCYKLCNELGADLQKVEEVARQIIKFVKLKKVTAKKYGLVKIKPFWEQEEWAYFWSQRQANKILEEKKKICWRSELRKIIDKFDENSDAA